MLIWFVRSHRVSMAALVLAALAACAPPPPNAPRPTAPVILEITPAPTLDIDTTATVYARQSIPTPTPAGLYVVQRGDTLSSLAEEFGTTVEEIMAANRLTDPNTLQAGQTLIIPSLISTTLVIGTPSPPAATALPTSTTTLAETPIPTLSTP